MPHQVEEYALTTGLRIEKMNLFETYFPLGFDNEYIVVITGAGVEANKYPHYQVVVASLKEALHAKGIKIIQLGDAKDERIGADLDLCGGTSLHQYFWLMKNAKLSLSGDTSALHLAGHYNIPLVSVFGVSHPSISRAYFGDPSKQRYILPEYTNGRPSFFPGENPAVIAAIKPEVVAEAVAELIGLEIPKTTTVEIGEDYKFQALVVVPNTVVRADFFPSNILNLRYDIGGTEEDVVKQLIVRKCQIFTDKPMNVAALSNFRANIERIIYNVTENDSPEFVRDLQLAGIPVLLQSYLSEEEIGLKKISYMDIGAINKLEISTRPENIDLEDLKFLTNRIILDNNKMYLSWAHREAGKSIDRLNNNVDNIIDVESFWKDRAFYYLFK